MLKSMTGFGAAAAETDARVFTVEVRTLNSKTLDVSLRLPRLYSDKEIEVRNLIGQVLERGKISVFVDVEEKSLKTSSSENIDKDILRNRIQVLKELADEYATGQSAADLLEMAFRWPAVAREQTQAERLTDEQTEWTTALACIRKALAECEKFRADEGLVLEQKLLEYNQNIRQNLGVVRELDPQRAPRVRARLEEKLADFLADGRMEQGRLEQEMIFHLERLDIAEELVRLDNHLNYFEQTIKTDDNPGKKIGFISQEMGREINTIGSKANDAAMQQRVVAMKEELEKIKEQSANIL